MIDFVLNISASLIAIIAYLAYFLTVKQSGIIPNRLAWLISSISVCLETLTYYMVSDDYVQSSYFIVCSICCILITIKVWNLAKWEGASKTQKYSLVFYSMAIAIWPLFQLPFIAHLLLLIVIPFAFYPIYKSAYKNYKTENSTPWLLWSISDILVIISICSNLKTIQQLPYVLVSFVCPFTVYAIIMIRRIVNTEKTSWVFVYSNHNFLKLWK